MGNRIWDSLLTDDRWSKGKWVRIVIITKKARLILKSEQTTSLTDRLCLGILP